MTGFAIVLLSHMEYDSRYDLHPLPVCTQVSAFGDDHTTDSGDVWIVEWDTKGKLWKQETKVSRASSS